MSTSSSLADKAKHQRPHKGHTTAKTRSKPGVTPTIPKGYVVQDTASVLAVLARRSGLVLLLDDMRRAVDEFFPGHQGLELEVVGAPSYLVASVITDAPEATDWLARFDDEWITPRQAHLCGRLYLTLARP